MHPPFHYAGAAPLQALPPPVAGVPVREVWAGNLDAEVSFLHNVATGARFVAFAVHYPGVVHGAAPPQADHNTLTPEQRYAAIKANVDALKPLQVGLASARTTAAAYLEERGMDLDAHRVHGIPMARFADALHCSGLLRRLDLSWISYTGAYHVVYLLKVIRGGLPLPGDMRVFLGTARRFLGGDIYDVACMAGDCPSMPVGLERIADKLINLARPVGSPLLAGAGGVLALQAFAFLRVRMFHGDVLLHGL
ncbi:hypothetical protein BAE44_0019139 [Dichanthelium oligosanthes]|uniref:poly(A)-specific ribonuclease n=1 Tax=Dichanthelium oligosanthes TaxID=888268 RepID=A0A1E5V3W7_9POAL|nr:hypothetical protein BAE44_0019139 [Dichanthelium oligosanthes]